MSRPVKFLLTLLLLLAIAAGGIWIIGSKKGRYPTTLLINATPAQIFPYICDYDLIKQWKSNIVEIQSDSSGDLEVGDTAAVIVDQNGRQIKFATEVLRYMKNEYVSVQARNSTQIHTSVFKLEKKDDGTTILTYRVRTQNQGLGKLIGPFSRHDLGQQVIDDARRLKQLVESQADAQAGEGPTGNRSQSEAATSSDETISHGNAGGNG